MQRIFQIIIDGFTNEIIRVHISAQLFDISHHMYLLDRAIHFLLGVRVLSEFSIDFEGHDLLITHFKVLKY